MCFSNPDTTPELRTQTQSCLSDGPTRGSDGYRELISARPASGLLPITPAPPGASAFLPSSPADPKPGLVFSPSLAFTPKPASSTFDTTQNLPISCHLHSFHHLVSGPMPPGPQDPAPSTHTGCSPHGRQRAPVNAASGCRPFLLRGNPPGSHQAQGKSPTPNSPQYPVNVPPSPTCPRFAPTLAPSPFPESHSHLAESSSFSAWRALPPNPCTAPSLPPHSSDTSSDHLNLEDNKPLPVQDSAVKAP